MAFDAVLNLPLKRFWFLANQIDRLRAEVELRQLQILSSTGDAEAFKVASENLQKETGSVFVWEDTGPSEIRIDPTTGLDPEFDRAGLRALKGMGKIG